MIIDYLRQLHQSVLDKIIQFTDRKNWKLVLTIATPIIVLFFSFPSYEWMFNEIMSNWKFLFEQAAHPFTQTICDPSSHQAKLTFRLFVPLLIRLFHLNIIGITIVQFLFGMATVYFFIRSILKITNNKTVTVLFTLAFAATAICTNPFNDILGYLDGFALFFLVLPFAFNSPIIIFIAVFFAAWVDERGLIASSLIFLWILFIKKENKKIVEITAVVFAWIAYFSIRFFIAYKYHLLTHTESTGISMLLHQFNNLPLGIWTGLEGFWLLICFAFIVLIKQNKKLIALLFFIGILLIIMVALSVSDITRSMIYLFPGIFIALAIVKEVETDKNLIRIATVVLLLCALFPQLNVGGYNSVNWQYPFPLQMIRYALKSLFNFSNVLEIISPKIKVLSNFYRSICN